MLSRNYGHALRYLRRLKVLFCAYDLAKINCATFGHESSNLAEGEMGNLVKYRKLYIQRERERE